MLDPAGVFVSFADPVPFSVGASPKSLAVGEFTGNANLDLVVANNGVTNDGTNSNDVSVLLGDGSGNFSLATNYSVGNNPIAVVAGDFNSNNQNNSQSQDLAVANYTDNNVSILLNDGTGNFAAPTNFTVGNNPVAIVEGDFGNGEQDLAVANSNSNNVSILLGNGKGNFSAATNFTVGSHPDAIAVGDFGNGKQDLAVVNYGDNTVTILLNNGTGQFTTATTLAVGNNPDAIAVGDFGNGHVDLAVANGGDNTVTVFLNDGTGNFSTATNYSVGLDPRAIAVGDFNGDGHLDLAVANYSDNSVSVLLGNGTGGFMPAVNFSVNSPLALVTGEFTSSGQQDLAVTNLGDQTVSVLLNQTNSTNPTLNLVLSNDSVDENAAPQTVVGTLSTNEPSETFTYSLVSGVGSNDNTDFTINGNQLEILNSPDESKPSYSILVQATDNNNTQNFLDQNLTIYVNDTSSPPVLSAGIIQPNLTVLENSNATSLGLTGLAYQPGPSNAGDTLIYTVTAVPIAQLGSIYLADGTTLVTADTQYQLADIQGMQFKPAANATSNLYGQGNFIFQVQDTSEPQIDALLQTIIITVNPVSQVPVETGGNINNLTVLENANTTPLGLGDLAYSPLGNTLTYTVIDVPNAALGSIYLADGTTEVKANTQYQLTDIQGMQFKPATNANSTSYGTGEFSFTVQNNVDPSQNTLTESLNINVTPVNQPPVLTAGSINNLNVLKNSGVSSLGLSGLAFAPGGGIDQANDILTYTVIAVPDSSLGNIVLADGTTPVTANSTYTLTQLQGMEFQTASNAKGIGNFSFEVQNNGGTANGGHDSLTESLAVEVNPIPLQLSNIGNDVFNLQGDNTQEGLQVSIISSDSQQIDELGVYTVDDAQGTINGLAPGDSGYAQAALARGRVLFSSIVDLPNGFSNNTTSSLLQFNPGSDLRFYLVQNSTTDDILARKASIDNVLFSNPSNEKITALGNNSFSLAWQDSSGSSNANFPNLVVKIQPTNDPSPLGSDLQGQIQSEFIDLRSSTQPVTATFTAWRYAAYNNFAGFYQVIDTNGDINFNGTVLHPGNAGYVQAAVSSRVGGIGLTVDQNLQLNAHGSEGEQTFTGTFQPGAIFAPFLIANGTPDQVLNGNSANTPYVYFPFLGANPDQINHVRLLGNNTFAFEDQFNGGDRDYNDMIIRINLTTQS